MGGSWSAAASVNLAKSGNISRNAPCPCGSRKKYKRHVLFVDSRKMKQLRGEIDAVPTSS